MKSPFGLLAFIHWNHDWNNGHFPKPLVQKAADQIKDLGVGTIRFDIVWSDIHRGPGQYDFSHYDPIIELLSKKGIGMLALLHYNKDRLDANGKEIWSNPPDSFEEFAAYVGATIARYKSKIKYWEIWNEPNHPVYWSKPKDDMKSYVELLKLSYAAAKKEDPDCVVINGGITEPVVEDVRNFYKAGGGAVTDILTIHTFLDPNKSDHENQFDAIIQDVRKTMVEYGDEDKKIWITEMGCPGVPDHKQVKNWWAGKNLDEQQQADWLEKQYLMIRKYPFIQKLFWAFYRDTGDFFGDGTDFFGLVRFDLSPKPSFDRLKRLINKK